MNSISFLDNNIENGLKPKTPWVKRLKNETERNGKDNIASGLFCSKPNILPFTVCWIPRIVPQPGQIVPVILFQGQGGK